MNQKMWTPGSGVLDQVMSAPVTPVKRGMRGVDMLALGFVPGINGGKIHGTHQQGDVLTKLADGTPLDGIWNDFMALLNVFNAPRTDLISFLTFPVTSPVEYVAQAGSGVDFEKSSQYGVPVASRVTPSWYNLGYGFDWWDLGARYTWQYLADATSTMVDSVANAAVEAAIRLRLTEVLRCVFNPSNLATTINQQSYTVYKFFNADGTVPPTYKSNVFDGNHTHYKTTGSQGTNDNTLEAQDLDVLIVDDFASHGYSLELGYTLVLMVNTTNGNTIRGFRSATNTAQTVAGPYGRYDFVPAQGQPGQFLIQNETLIGQQQVAGTLKGLTVIGTYGPLVVVQDDYIPSTHVFAFATGGPASLGNPIGLRSHANNSLQGLRLVKGKTPDYPLIDSYWNIGFGTGIRQRGGGIVLDLVSGTTYAPPAIYA